MTVTVKEFDETDELHIVIDGKFDFSALKEFRDAYEGLTKKYKRYVIDMRSVDMIDSSALGMLLKMKRTLELGDKDIHIINCNVHVKKILQISKFDTLFYID